MPIGARRPFTELFEVAQNELVREAASGVEGKYRGFVNQVYMNDLISVLPETYIRKKGYITTVADYTTGTVTVGSGTSNIIGASTSWTSANSDDLNIKISGKDRIYRMTFVAGTSLTFQDSLTWTTSSGSGLSYRLIQNRYSLSSDFSYMISDDSENPCAVSYMLNGSEIFIPPMINDEYSKQYNDSISTTFSGYTVTFTSSTTKYLQLWPNPDTTDIIGYWYIPILTSLAEYTTGTVTFTTGTAVVGAGSMQWLTGLTTANEFYIRNDADGTGSSSVWAKISSFANATALSLSAGFSGTSGTGITYTIAEASKWPARFDDAILYRVASLVDPDSLQVPKWQAFYQDAIGLDKTTESRRNKTSQFKSFPGSRR